MTQHDKRLVGIVSLLMIVATTIPYVVGLLSAPDGYLYTGGHSFNYADAKVYYDHIAQIASGSNTVVDRFTPEAQEHGTFNLVWWIAGLVTRLLPNKLPIILLVYQLLRIISIVLLCIVLMYCIRQFIADQRRRNMAFVLTSFAGGWGLFFASALIQLNPGSASTRWWPIDLWVPEAYVFSSAYHSVHFVLSIVALLLTFTLFYKALERRSLSLAGISGIIALIHFSFHPYYLPVVYGALGLYVFIRSFRQHTIQWHEFGYVSLVVGLSVWSALYHVWLIAAEPVLAARALQNITMLPGVMYVILGFGIWLPTFVWIIFASRRQNRALTNQQIFLLCWITVFLIFMFLPFQFQSRYTQTLSIALIIFIFSTLDSRYFEKLWQNIKNPGIAFLIGLVCCSTPLLYIARDVSLLRLQLPDSRTLFYIPSSVVDVGQYLNLQLSKAHAVVLAARQTSIVLPAVSGAHVFFAHTIETIDYSARQDYVQAFFDTRYSDRFRKAMLERFNITHVVYGQYEKNLGSYDPSMAEFLEPIYHSGDTTLYAVDITLE